MKYLEFLEKFNIADNVVGKYLRQNYVIISQCAV